MSTPKPSPDKRAKDLQKCLDYRQALLEMMLQEQQNWLSAIDVTRPGIERHIQHLQESIKTMDDRIAALRATESE